MDKTTLHKLIYKGGLKLGQSPCDSCNNSTSKVRLHFHGSDVGKCKRAIYYSMHNKKSVIESGLTSMFLFAGHLFEALIIRCLELAGDEIKSISCNDGEDLAIEIKKQIVVNGVGVDVKIIGHYDAVINGDTLLEIKSVKNTSFKSVFLKSDLSQRKQYYGQVQTYLAAMTHIKRAYLIGINRENCEVAPPIEINREPGFMEKVYKDYANIIYYGILNNQLPTRDHENKNDYECRYCDYREFCWDNNGLKASEIDFNV